MATVGALFEDEHWDDEITGVAKCWPEASGRI